jgi:hypothetical protein
MSEAAVEEKEPKTTKEPKESIFSAGFLLVLLFLVFNISFSWFSPKIAAKLSPILIDETEAAAEDASRKLPDIKVLPTLAFSKVGNTIKVETSIRGVTSRMLKNICDRKSQTKLNMKGEARAGDNVTLKYSKSFPCKGISLRLNGPKELKAQLQVSTDGIVFSAVKLLVPGSNDVKLKNENIKAVRIVVSEKIKGNWSLGDVSCR